MIIAHGGVASQFAWEQLLRDAFGSIELKKRPLSHQTSRLRQIPIANLKLIEAISDSKEASRTSRNIATDDDEYFILILVLDGRLQISQFGRDCELSRNTFGLFHLSSPSYYRHQERTHVIDLKIPAATLRSYIRDPHRYVAIARPAANGIGRVVGDLFKSLMGQAACMPEWALHSCAGQMMGVVATAIECSGHDAVVGSPAIRSSIFKRAEAYIEINAGDPLLNATAVAKSVGISVRYLQKVFQEQGLSIGEVIRNCRLERCYDDLLCGKSANSLVKEVAFKGGFRSPSHFSTAFKRRYGVTPDELRKDPSLITRNRPSSPGEGPLKVPGWAWETPSAD